MTRQLGTVVADADLHEAIATMNQGAAQRRAACRPLCEGGRPMGSARQSQHPGCRAPE
jgi:hypothetical protein